MPKLPEDVETVKRTLAGLRSHECSKVASKLILNTPDLSRMWATLERRKVDEDDLWVWGFLQSATHASELPPYHYLTAKERRELSTRIVAMAKKLSRAIQINGLDGHLIYSAGQMFRGFYLFEDFGDANQARIDATGTEKLQLSRLIGEIAQRSAQKIDEEPQHGKIGKNARAVRFVRLMAIRNKRLYGETLNAVTATAANAIFGTNYVDSDIRKLLSR